MNRFTFHIVWLLLTLAGVLGVLGGPLWGFPPALLLAMILAAFIVAYPTDASLRFILAGMGLLFIAGGLANVMPQGLTPTSLQAFCPVLLLGISCLWAAAFPMSAVNRDAAPLTPRTFPTDGPPCPQCSAPLRTAQAQQCFHCGADWH